MRVLKSLWKLVSFVSKLIAVIVVGLVVFAKFTDWLFKREFGFDHNRNGARFYQINNLLVLHRLDQLGGGSRGFAKRGRLTRARLLAWLFGYSHQVESTNHKTNQAVTEFAQGRTPGKRFAAALRSGAVRSGQRTGQYDQYADPGFGLD